jgi:phosphate transport system substrate-binding protein
MLIIAMIFIPVLGGNAFAGQIRLGTGETANKAVISLVRAPFEKTSGITLVTLKSGSGSAFIELVKGNLDASTSDMNLDELIAKAKKQGTEVGERSAYQYAVIEKFKVVSIINKENPVKNLSKEQLNGIFSGTVANWKDVGGPDLPIMVVWNASSEGLNSLFTKSILDKAPVSKDKAEVFSHKDVIQIVANTPEAIGLASIKMVDSTVKSPGGPEISREILLVTKGKPSNDVQKLIDFIKTSALN